MGQFLSRIFLLPGDGRNRNQAMEGLRGFAVGLIFLTHFCRTYSAIFHEVDFGTGLAAQPGKFLKTLYWGSRSSYGVELFFILSGFLIVRLLIARQGRFSYGSYLGQRVLRLYPAMLVSLVVMTFVVTQVFCWKPYVPVEFVKSALLFTGIMWIPMIAYHPVTWSLTFEFIFYIFCPVLLLFRRLGVLSSPARFAAAAWPVAVLLFCLPGMYSRAAMILAGGWLAVHTDEQLRGLARRVPDGLVVAFYFVATALFAFHPSMAQWGNFVPVFAVPATLLVLKACYGDGLLHRLFSIEPLRYLGNVSYSFYLIHELGVEGACRGLVSRLAPLGRNDIKLVVTATAAFAFSFAAATALYLLTERGYFVGRAPGVPWWRRYQGVVVVPATAMLVLVFMLRTPTVQAELAGTRSLMVFDAAHGFDKITCSGESPGEQRDGKLVVHSKGFDPCILLPPLPEFKAKTVYLKVDLNVPDLTFLQVFYLLGASDTYSELNSVRLQLTPGDNRVVLKLPKSELCGPMRLDPAECPGDVVIRSIELLGDRVAPQSGAGPAGAMARDEGRPVR